MSKISKISLVFSILIMSVYAIGQCLLFFDLVNLSKHDTLNFGFICFGLFIPFFSVVTKDILTRSKKSHQLNIYTKELTEVLISQSHNSLFYEGKLSSSAKELTKQVALSICTDRCSVWLYNKSKTSIVCQQLYVKSEDIWYQDIELFQKDFENYFDTLAKNPIIIASDAELHPATSCFKDSYLRPLGIKSMLDVPIIYRGQLIGVICIESLTRREWIQTEVNFSQMLASMYSFAYSIREGNKQKKITEEIDKFIDEATLVSKADAKGKITYVNKRFTEVSGWSFDESIGEDHRIVNSGFHTKEFWENMYRTTVKDKKIWNNVVTNRTKSGGLYYVDTYIKADFDLETDDLLGFMSIRQDVSEIIEALNELDKKNSYLEHAAKILRHDMHSGINTYIPRGISSLERRLTEEDIKNFKIEAPLKMIKDGLKHTQKVYKGVYEFTNMVKKNVVLSTQLCNIKEILADYLSTTAYKSQVILDDSLPELLVNEPLFCTAVDNLIRNGLKYNDSPTKFVRLYYETERKQFGLRKRFICIEDNGRGMTQDDFNHLSRPYVRKEGQKEEGTGLGLNICKSILIEHKFEMFCEKIEQGGTKIKIKIK
jgi:PAS domain S-box-containing protein